MKYFNTLRGLCVLFCLVSLHQTAQSQCDTNCSISCTGQINLSLGTGCEAEITPWMGGKSIAVGDTICYSVVVFDQHNQIIPNNTVDISHVNKLLTFKVTENECNNFCWGNVLVEYKQGPQIVCPPDLTIECNGLESFELPLPEDLCASVSIDLINEVHNALDCDPDHQAFVTRTYRAVDEFGNTNFCSHDIYLRRVPISEIIFPEFTTINCSDENILYDEDNFPLPWFFNSLTDSLSVFGVPFICSNTIESPYMCPSSGVPAINDCGSVITSLDANGMVTVGLSLTNPSVSASCVAGDFSLSFSATSSVSALDYDCNTLGSNTYTLYLLDGATVVATCQNTIEIIDSGMLCSEGGTGSGTGSGTTGGAGAGGGTTTSTGGGVTTSTGIGGGCTFGIPLFPEGGGVIITETGDVNNPFEVEVAKGNLSNLCGAVLTYSDTEFPTGKNTCKRKILRTWEAYEWWCDEELHVTSVQIIEIIDDRAPVFTCPSDLTISTNVDCGADIQMPNIVAVDDCGGDITVTMEYPNGTVTGNNQLVDLNAGSNAITYIVSDGCNNSSSCTINYTIIDYTNPVAICEQSKVISLRGGDVTKVPAEVFDFGSYDDCSIDKIQVKRQDASCGPEAIEWSDYAHFCCADAIAGTVPVEFRVIDASGNSSECIVYVEIQDKSNPIVNCPPDMTIDCNETYSAQNMGLTFGFATTDTNCDQSEPIELLEDAFDQCGVGVMVRTFQLQGTNGNVIAECRQNITVTNDNPFTAADIVWPQDLEVTDLCDAALLTPDNLEAPFAFPTFSGTSQSCALLGHDFTDQIFSADPNSGDCTIIQRTWTVLNWCGAGGDFSTFVIPRPQLIKIRNTTAPVMDAGADLVFSGLEVDCNSGRVDIVRSATDDCDNALSWTYSIRQTADGALVQTGTEPEIHGKYPVGNYTIEWRVFDSCGNSDFHIQNVQVISLKAPTPLCLNGLSAKLIDWDTDGDGLPDVKKVDLWASDFDAGSYPNCGNEIVFSFSSDTMDTRKSFFCADLGRNVVEMWATDSSTGAQDFCITFIDIQDDGDCPQQATAILAGQVLTETQQEVEDVEIHLDNTSIMEMTDANGAYAFPQMPVGGDYEISPIKDSNHLDGVSTLDLIMIQRHILDIEKLDSPYKYIAADIDHNQVINGVDLVELRKLILGLYSELPLNDSWRFVSADYQFVDPYNPWSADITETYKLIDLTNNMVVDFVGVKIGDVNNDAVLNFDDQLNSRSNTVVDFAIADHQMDLGVSNSVMVYSSNYQDLRGWQGTLEFDNTALEIIDVLPQALPLTESNFSIDGERGHITFSYHSEIAQEVGYGTPLFELVVRARKDNTSVMDVMQFSSTILKSEAYQADYSISDIELVEYLKDESKILSVNPNPFIDNAELQYFSAYQAPAEFEFFDLDGHLLYASTVPSQLGINTLSVSRDQLSVTGFVYVRMRIQGEISEFRMILL